MRTYKEQAELIHEKVGQYNVARKKRMKYIYGSTGLAACLVLTFAFIAISELPMFSRSPDLMISHTPIENESPTIDTQPSDISLANADSQISDSNLANNADISADEQIPASENLLPPEFIGLPMDNNCLSVEHHPDNMEVRRMGVSSLLDIFGTPGRAISFWSERPVQAFAFVRVIETTQEEYHQTSTVEVLRTVWSRERDLPETMTLTQFARAIMCCSPYGELMREGGVFLLPLWYNDGIDDWRELGWYNWTYFDVLFEVDNNGLIWSRSSLSAFNRFDGRHTSLLTNAILGIANGDNNLGRDIAHSPLGWAADDSVLAIVTAVSTESINLFPDSPGREIWANYHTVRIDEVLSLPTEFGWARNSGGWLDTQLRWRENWQASDEWWQDLKQSSVITAVNSSFTVDEFETGERYLVFITPSYSDWNAQFTFFWESAAKINLDGTITPIWDTDEYNLRIFDEYNGYTTQRIARLARLANTWHKVYS